MSCSSKTASSATATKKPSTSINGFTVESVPPHHYHLGEGNYVVVSDFADVITVHIRKYRMDENGQLFPSKQGVSFSPFVWESLSKEISELSLPSDSKHAYVICDTLFLCSAWIENIPHVSLQRFIAKKDYSRQFLPSLCLLSEREWDKLQCIRKRISESCKSLMFGDMFKKRIRLEILTRSSQTDLEMELDDVQIILSTSLTEILATYLKNAIDKVFVCQGCIEIPSNQMGHECLTLNYAAKLRRYGALALASIDIELLVRDFINQNIQMLNYINGTFLNDLNIDLFIKSASDMYIASDRKPYSIS